VIGVVLKDVYILVPEIAIPVVVVDVAADVVEVVLVFVAVVQKLAMIVP